MKKIFLSFFLILLPLVQHGQIIADHSIVDRFDDIPQYYIDEVKKMMVWFPGESHSNAYRDGLELLEAMYPTYDCNVQWGFQAYTSTRLRVTAWPTEGIGEEYWYTWKAYEPGSLPPASTTFKDYIKNNSDAKKPISAMGFAWCYDMVHQHGPTANADPILGVHWYGTSVGGPDGDKEWGIDVTDKAETRNNVSLKTYFAAMEDYIDYCKSNSYPTKMIFTTGPVDKYTGEGGYQVYLKNEAIRSYVAADPTGILFDYADILCYNDNGTSNNTSWNGHTYPIITTTNVSPEQTGHISNAGAIRLAKAQWWLLARLAGWDGVSTGVNDARDNKAGSIKKIISHDEIKLLLSEYFLSWNANLFDFQGTLISNKPVEYDILTFDITFLSPGIYFVVLSNGRERRVEKFIKS